jgi:hypothetical protein
MDEIVKRLREIIDDGDNGADIRIKLETLISDIETPFIDWGPTVCSGEALVRMETDKERETRIKRQRLGFL